MGRWRCKKCGYDGDELVFEFTSYEYCMATNAEEPDHIDNVPDWVNEMGLGSGDIGRGPLGCPKCHAWGEDNFEEIMEESKTEESRFLMLLEISVSGDASPADFRKEIECFNEANKNMVQVKEISMLDEGDMIAACVAARNVLGGIVEKGASKQIQTAFQMCDDVIKSRV